MEMNCYLCACRYFKKLVTEQSPIHLLSLATILQSDLLLWLHRKGRTTASNFGTVCHTALESLSKSLVRSVFQQNNVPRTAAMWLGLEKAAVPRVSMLSTLRKNMSHSRLIRLESI